MGRKFQMFGVLALLVLVGIAATRQGNSGFKNLQILPQDITPARLDSIMNSYTRALGMGCGFCHTPLEGMPDSLDYASDKNEMKLNARNMMRLTMDINQKYFYYDTTVPPVYLNVVRCQTCHRGEPYPVE